MLEFSKITLPSIPVAGDYTETLTFGIAVKDSGKTVDLSKLTGGYEAQDGDILRGTYTAKNKITVASGATVTLRQVNITGEDDSNYTWAGITCEGDATLVLKDENTVIGFDQSYPAVYVPEGSTLIIQGNGTLNARSNGLAAGIGGGDTISCGNIMIRSGTINAVGGTASAGIGSTRASSCGDIRIIDGTVTATGGKYAAGIGSGATASCGDITISGGTVTAHGGDYGAGIGSGYMNSSCGNITVSNTVTKVIATKKTDSANSIGAG